MLLNVPGFAPAWETAKTDSHNELAEEEAGRSAPKRLFSRLFGGGAGCRELCRRDTKAKVAATERTVTRTDCPFGQFSALTALLSATR
jgi:hypothetical protein